MRRPRLLFLPSGSRWWKAYLALGTTYFVLLAASFVNDFLDDVYRVATVVIIVTLVVLYFRERRAYPEDFR